MKVIVTSDQHLGADNSDKLAFNAFLDKLQEDDQLTDFVLLGDVVDMWRRDASGVFLENQDTIQKIITLRSRGVNVYYIAGNHDYHVLNLQRPTYPFKFLRDLELHEAGVTYRFVHGYGYDAEQKEHFMALLCRVMSDTAGAFESNLWTEWNHIEGVLSKLYPEFARSELRATIDRLQRTPHERLKNSVDKINAAACKDVKPNEILIFGHTHMPFINKTENVVNSGSWVTDATPHNTYVEIIKGKPRLYIFGDKIQEITDRIQC